MKQIFRNIVVAILTWEARTVLRKYKPRVIAVTGSVGKTSTKDAIYAALEDSLYVRKSRKSFNSDIGVPLTILGCESGWSNPLKWLQNIVEGGALILFPNHYPKWLILEVGTHTQGDITELTEWLKPDVVVVTALPDVPVHVENFKSPEHVAREKKKLVEALKSDGVLVLCGDDKRTAALRKEFARYESILYGTELHNDIAATHVSVVYESDAHPTSMHFQVERKGESFPFVLSGRLGHQQVYPVLAALAVGQVLGVPAQKVVTQLSAQAPSPGRMRVLEGHNATTIIDDSYNSSPTALRAAVTTLKKIDTPGRKIVIVGDMLELGRYSAEAHKKAGVQIASVADVLIAVGVRAKTIAQAAREAGFDPQCIQEFDSDDAREAGRTVRAMLEESDVVLVKGSQAIRLERAVKEVLKEPARAPEVLVRQEDAWLAV